MDDDKKRRKVNESYMKKVRAKLDRANCVLSECLTDVQNVPCFTSDEVKILSDAIDNLNMTRAKLESIFNNRIQPEDWST